MGDLPAVPDYFGQFVAPIQRQQQLGIEQQNSDLQRQQLQMEQQQQAMKLRQQALFQQDAASVIANPTPQGFQQLFLKHPEMHEDLKAAWDQYSDGEKQRDTSQASQVYAALSNGRSDLALQLLKDRKAALANSGGDDKTTDALIDMVESGDPAKVKQAQAISGFALATSTGQDHIASTLEALGKAGPDAKGQVVGRSIGHYENGEFKVDYRDPDAPQYREVQTVDKDGNPVTQIVRVGGGGAPSSSSGAGVSGADGSIAHVLDNEGGYNPKDANGSPTNFGINFKANKTELAKIGVTAANFKNLTKDQAEQIYATKYWPASGADKLPANLQAPYFDAYVRSPAIAKRAYAQSGGDPQKFVQIASATFQKMASNPNSGTAPYAKAWANRDAGNMAIASTGSSGDTAAAPAVPIFTAKAAGEDGALDPSTTSFYAQQILAGGQMPTLGMGKAAAAARRQIMSEVAKEAGAEGLTGTDLAVQIAHYQAGKKRAATLENQFGTIQANEQTALANGQQFLDRSRELSGQSRFPIVNSVTQSYLRHTGDPTVAAMDAAWNTFSSEYAKVISGSPSGAGVLSDSARHEAMGIMRGNYSMAQKEASFKQMQADMSNRINAIQQSISNTYSSITKNPRSTTAAKSSDTPVRVRTPQEAAALPSGTLFTTPDGRTLRKK